MLKVVNIFERASIHMKKGKRTFICKLFLSFVIDIIIVFGAENIFWAVINT